MSRSEWSNVELAAKELSANWRTWEGFAWFGPEWADEHWCYVEPPVADCQATLLDESNWHVIQETLTPYAEQGTVELGHHSHSGVAGKISSFLLRITTKDGEITPAFRAYCELMARLADYPVLDEADWSNREYEATLDHIARELRWIHDDIDYSDKADEVFSWLWDNDQHELESIDDQGGFPSEESLIAALKGLELWVEMEEDDA